MKTSDCFYKIRSLTERKNIEKCYPMKKVNTFKIICV